LVFVRPEEVIVPPSLSKAGNTTYELESTAIDHGLHVAGTTEAWGAEIAALLRGNSNVALSFGTFFGSPLLTFASEPGGGWHLQHGAVGRDWQRYLVNLGPDQIKAQLHQHREAFAALLEIAAVDAKAHPQVRAAINRFALCAAALRMAIAAQLLPWSVEEADAGIVACMQRWVAQRGNVNTAGELQRAAAPVSVTIRAALSDRFITIHKPNRGWEPATEADEIKQRSAGGFDGYVKTDQDPGQVRVLVRPEVWPRYCNGANSHEIAKHLQERGTLIPGGDGKLSKAEQVIGRVERFYVLFLTQLTP
jgi:hypothetical protein